MRAKYPFQTRLFAYILLVLSVVASAAFLLYVYLSNFAYDIPQYGEISFETVAAAGPKLYSNGQMLIKTDIYTFNSLANNCCPVLPRDTSGSVFSEAAAIDGFYLLFKEINGKEDCLYINLPVYESVVLSFKSNFVLSFEKGGALLSFGNMTLGTLELPFSHSFWKILKLPETVFIPLDNRGLLYLSSLDIENDGVVTLVYDYDETLLSETFSTILSESDERKVDFHSAKDDVDERLITLARKKSVTAAEAKELVIGFEKDPQTFLSLCLLLSENGIRALYSNFGESYYKYVSADKLVEASENAIDSDLNAFSDKFSRLLLQYLYKNPDYEIRDGTIYVRNVPLEPETILHGLEDGDVYSVEILASETGISAIYGISGYQTERSIISGE